MNGLNSTTTSTTLPTLSSKDIQQLVYAFKNAGIGNINSGNCPGVIIYNPNRVRANCNCDGGIPHGDRLSNCII